MDERTRSYLRGRFGDHYRRTDIVAPPEARTREWGYIPWSEGPDTTMIRHRSTLDLGDLSTFLARERPRHVYFSAGRYDAPGANSMSAKGWRSSDLIFDLDADHLPEVDLGTDDYAVMLEKCKGQLWRLLSFLRDDFAFRKLTIVFSGNRGYHVHVRDESVQSMESEQRREIVDYVRGTGLAFEELTERELVAGSAGRQSPAPKRTLPPAGGWGARVHEAILDRVDELLEMDEDDGLTSLSQYDGIGEGKAEAALSAARENRQEIAAGNVDVHPAFFQIARRIAPEAIADAHAHIDEPVTTDVNRLIRLPGSLHGGSGLAVERIDPSELADFDPMVDAIPETFRGHEVRVVIEEDTTISVGGETFSVAAGDHSLPEYQAVHLMCRGEAQKGTE